MERKIIRNRIKCKHCGDIIESISIHDFKFCSCGKVAIDGGKCYLKRTGNPNDWEELSEYKKSNIKSLHGCYIRCKLFTNGLFYRNL